MDGWMDGRTDGQSVLFVPSSVRFAFRPSARSFVGPFVRPFARFSVRPSVRPSFARPSVPSSVRLLLISYLAFSRCI